MKYHLSYSARTGLFQIAEVGKTISMDTEVADTYHTVGVSDNLLELKLFVQVITLLSLDVTNTTPPMLFISNEECFNFDFVKQCFDLRYSRLNMHLHAPGQF